MSARVVSLREVVLENLAQRCVSGALRLPCAARVLRAAITEGPGRERVDMLADVADEIANARWFSMAGRDGRDPIVAAVRLMRTDSAYEAAATLAHLDSACTEDESDQDFVMGQAAVWATEQGAELSGAVS